MDTTLVVRVIVLVVSLAGCIVLLFAGFRMAGVRKRKDPEDTTLHRIPKDKLIRATLLLLGSVLCMSVAYMSMHYPDYVNGVCTMDQLITACIVAVAKSFGWIVLIPWLLNIFAKSGHRGSDTDKM